MELPVGMYELYMVGVSLCEHTHPGIWFVCLDTRMWQLRGYVRIRSCTESSCGCCER